MSNIVGFAALVIVLAAALAVALFRVTVLFPIRGIRQGWRKSFLKYRYSFAILAALLLFEAANFTGFSWSRFRWLSEAEIVDTAIRKNYPKLYSNAAELKKDYTTFEPEVSYWKDWTGEAGSKVINKLLGLKTYQVRLPDAVVIVSADGKARFSRRCCSGCYCSPMIPPDHPRLGVVGTVQYGEPDYPVASDFSVRWTDGSSESVFTAGHCFSAFRESQNPSLEIAAPGVETARIEQRHGYYLVSVFLGKDHSKYGTTRISKSDFLNSKDCNPQARQAWPSMGYGWKR